MRSWAKKEARRDHVWNQLLIADFASTGHERPNGATVQIRYAINLSNFERNSQKQKLGYDCKNKTHIYTRKDMKVELNFNMIYLRE